MARSRSQGLHLVLGRLAHRAPELNGRPSTYILRHGVGHLLAAGRWRDAERCLDGFDFVADRLAVSDAPYDMLLAEARSIERAT